MIEKIPNLPDNVVGFTAKGKITAEDYEKTVIPTVEDAFSRHDKVRGVFHCGKEFDGMRVAAMWDDAKLGLKHYSGWERTALVSDLDWLRGAARLFGFVVPGELRVYHENELSDAVRWVSEN